MRRSDYSVNIYLVVNKPGNVQVPYLLENYDGTSLSNNKFVKFEYTGESLSWFSFSSLQGKVGRDKNYILISTEKIMRYNPSSSSSASYCSTWT